MVMTVLVNACAEAMHKVEMSGLRGPQVFGWVLSFLCDWLQPGLIIIVIKIRLGPLRLVVY